MVQTTMNLELVKFINSDLTWNAVKKGHRSTMRRPRKPATSSSDFGFASANKMQESIAFDYEKSGVAILGQHFADEVLDFPIKKRILKLQSPSLSNERARSAQSELPVGSKQVCHSMKSKNGSNSIDQSKSIEKVVPDLNDFSGIELLAAAACHSSVSESPAPMESSAVEEHTPPIVESSTNCVKDDIAPIDSEDYDSSVQDSLFPVTQTLCDDVNGGEEDKTEISVPSKDVRLHWDLNTSMDEWEEPCCDILVDPHSEKGYSKDGLQNETTNAESQQVKPDFDPSSKSDGGRQAVSEVVQGDKVTSDDRLSDCCGSNTVDKVKAGGYDSPAEDGELRDTWQKNEVEEEMECVDYESDNIYEDNFDTIESINKEAIGALSAVSVLPNNEIEQEDKKNPPSISNQLPEHSQSAISEEKGRTPSFGLHKNDSCIHRSRSENIEDSFSRGKRDFGQEKSTVRNGPSCPCRGWDSRNTHRYPSRPKHVIGGSSLRETPPISYNSRSTYTRPERNESYAAHRGISRDKYKSGLGFSKREEHSERKVSSFSSNTNRGAHKRRSRSESPIAWNFQKKRNVETKKESPNYNVNGQYRDTRASTHASRYSNYKYDLGRLKSSESDQFYPNSHSGRYPSHTNGQYDDEKYGGGRFRYYHVDQSFKTRNKDNGFRYTRNENRYFKDPIHKDDLQRE